MNVLAYDSHPNDKGRDIAEYVDWMRYLQIRCDLASLPIVPVSQKALSIKIILPG